MREEQAKSPSAAVPRATSRVAEPGRRVDRLAADPVELSRRMWEDVGLFRDREGLSRALAVLDPGWRDLDARLRAGDPLDPHDWRTASILTVGRLIARAALRREESRGGHYRSDFPDRDDIHWKKRVSERKD